VQVYEFITHLVVYNLFSQNTTEYAYQICNCSSAFISVE